MTTATVPRTPVLLPHIVCICPVVSSSLVLSATESYSGIQRLEDVKAMVMKCPPGSQRLAGGLPMRTACLIVSLWQALHAAKALTHSYLGAPQGTPTENLQLQFEGTSALPQEGF